MKGLNRLIILQGEINQSDLTLVHPTFANDVDPTSKMKHNPTSDFQRCTTSVQPILNVPQRGFNVDVALSQRCFNVTSTSVKAKSKPIWLVKNMDLQRD